MPMMPVTMPPPMMMAPVAPMVTMPTSQQGIFGYP
jgi:hypothetical protein